MFPLPGGVVWKTLLVTIFCLIIKEIRSEPKVVCYYTNWSVYRPGTAKFNPQNINPYLCTHLVYAFGGFTKDNTLKPFDKYQDIEQGGYSKFTGLKSYNKQLKTMLAIGGWNEGSSRFSPLMAHQDRRQQFVKNILKFLRQNHFDGLDLDWEYPAYRDGGKSRDKDNYAQFVQELRAEFDRESSKTGRPRLLITMAVPAGIEYIGKGYDIPKLNKYLDWFNILSYDYHSAYEPSVNHHAPLYSLEEDSEYNYDGELNIDYTVKHYLNAGAERDKIVLGIPTYGRSYTLINDESTDIGSPSDGPGEQGDATREKGYLAYYEICQNLKEDSDWTVIQPNSKAMGPYAYKKNQWVGYDDEAIVRKKAEYVADNRLGGIMFWSIDNDDFRGSCTGKPYPLIEAAKEALLDKLGFGDNEVSQPFSQKKPSRSRSRKGPTNQNKLEIDKSNDDISSIHKKPNRKRPTNKITSTTTTTTTTRRPVGGRTTTPEPPTTPDPGSDFKCEEEGFFSHPRDCKKYFWCLDSGPSNLGIVAHQFTCPSGLYFNPAADSCDFSRNVLCKKSKTTSTPKTSFTTAATTTSTRAPTTSRPKISRPTTTTTTTTTTEAAYEDEDYEDDPNEEIAAKYAKEEDPKVIKDLIDLIKKVGGVEELEKLLQQDGNTMTFKTNTGSESTTAPAISKSLYDRVLGHTNKYTSIKNRFKSIKLEDKNIEKEDDSIDTEVNKDNQNSNKYSSVIRNSRPNSQSEGLDKLQEFDGFLREKPKYVTIRRTTPKSVDVEKDKVESNDYEDEDEEEDSDDPNSSNVKSSSTITVSSTPSYQNLKRIRPGFSQRPFTSTISTTESFRDISSSTEKSRFNKYKTIERTQKPLVTESIKNDEGVVDDVITYNLKENTAHKTQSAINSKTLNESKVTPKLQTLYRTTTIANDYTTNNVNLTPNITNEFIPTQSNPSTTTPTVIPTENSFNPSTSYSNLELDLSEITESDLETTTTTSTSTPTALTSTITTLTSSTSPSVTRSTIDINTDITTKDVLDDATLEKEDEVILNENKTHNRYETSQLNRGKIDSITLNRKNSTKPINRRISTTTNKTLLEVADDKVNESPIIVSSPRPFSFPRRRNRPASRNPILTLDTETNSTISNKEVDMKTDKVSQNLPHENNSESSLISRNTYKSISKSGSESTKQTTEIHRTTVAPVRKLPSRPPLIEETETTILSKQYSWKDPRIGNYRPWKEKKSTDAVLTHYNGQYDPSLHNTKLPSSKFDHNEVLKNQNTFKSEKQKKVISAESHLTRNQIHNTENSNENFNKFDNTRNNIKSIRKTLTTLKPKNTYEEKHKFVEEISVIDENSTDSKDQNISEKQTKTDSKKTFIPNKKLNSNKTDSLTSYHLEKNDSEILLNIEKIHHDENKINILSKDNEDNEYTTDSTNTPSTTTPENISDSTTVLETIIPEIITESINDEIYNENISKINILNENFDLIDENIKEFEKNKTRKFEAVNDTRNFTTFSVDSQLNNNSNEKNENLLNNIPNGTIPKNNDDLLSIEYQKLNNNDTIEKVENSKEYNQISENSLNSEIASKVKNQVILKINQIHKSTQEKPNKNIISNENKLDEKRSLAVNESNTESEDHEYFSSPSELYETTEPSGSITEKIVGTDSIEDENNQSRKIPFHRKRIFIESKIAQKVNETIKLIKQDAELDLVDIPKNSDKSHVNTRNSVPNDYFEREEKKSINTSIVNGSNENDLQTVESSHVLNNKIIKNANRFHFREKNSNNNLRIKNENYTIESESSTPVNINFESDGILNISSNENVTVFELTEANPIQKTNIQNFKKGLDKYNVNNRINLSNFSKLNINSNADINLNTSKVTKEENNDEENSDEILQNRYDDSSFSNDTPETNKFEESSSTSEYGSSIINTNHKSREEKNYRPNYQRRNRPVSVRKHRIDENLNVNEEKLNNDFNKNSYANIEESEINSDEKYKEITRRVVVTKQNVEVDASDDSPKKKYSWRDSRVGNFRPWHTTPRTTLESETEIYFYKEKIPIQDNSQVRKLTERPKSTERPTKRPRVLNLSSNRNKISKTGINSENEKVLKTDNTLKLEQNSEKTKNENTEEIFKSVTVKSRRVINNENKKFKQIPTQKYSDKINHNTDLPVNSTEEQVEKSLNTKNSLQTTTESSKKLFTKSRAQSLYNLKPINNRTKIFAVSEKGIEVSDSESSGNKTISSENLNNLTDINDTEKEQVTTPIVPLYNRKLVKTDSPIYYIGKIGHKSINVNENTKHIFDLHEKQILDTFGVTHEKDEKAKYNSINTKQVLVNKYKTPTLSGSLNKNINKSVKTNESRLIESNEQNENQKDTIRVEIENKLIENNTESEKNVRKFGFTPKIIQLRKNNSVIDSDVAETSNTENANIKYIALQRKNELSSLIDTEKNINEGSITEESITEESITEESITEENITKDIITETTNKRNNQIFKLSPKRKYLNINRNKNLSQSNFEEVIQVNSNNSTLSLNNVVDAESENSLSGISSNSESLTESVISTNSTSKDKYISPNQIRNLVKNFTGNSNSILSFKNETLQNIDELDNIARQNIENEKEQLNVTVNQQYLNINQKKTSPITNSEIKVTLLENAIDEDLTNSSEVNNKSQEKKKSNNSTIILQDEEKNLTRDNSNLGNVTNTHFVSSDKSTDIDAVTLEAQVDSTNLEENADSITEENFESHIKLDTLNETQIDTTEANLYEENSDDINTATESNIKNNLNFTRKYVIKKIIPKLTSTESHIDTTVIDESETSTQVKEDQEDSTNNSHSKVKNLTDTKPKGTLNERIHPKLASFNRRNLTILSQSTEANASKGESVLYESDNLTKISTEKSTNALRPNIRNYATVNRRINIATSKSESQEDDHINHQVNENETTIKSTELKYNRKYQNKSQTLNVNNSADSEIEDSTKKIEDIQTTTRRYNYIKRTKIIVNNVTGIDENNAEDIRTESNSETPVTDETTLKYLPGIQTSERRYSTTSRKHINSNTEVFNNDSNNDEIEDSTKKITKIQSTKRRYGYITRKNITENVPEIDQDNSETTESYVGTTKNDETTLKPSTILQTSARRYSATRRKQTNSNNEVFNSNSNDDEIEDSTKKIVKIQSTTKRYGYINRKKNIADNIDEIDQNNSETSESYVGTTKTDETTLKPQGILQTSARRYSATRRKQTNSNNEVLNSNSNDDEIEDSTKKIVKIQSTTKRYGYINRKKKIADIDEIDQNNSETSESYVGTTKTDETTLKPPGILQTSGHRYSVTRRIQNSNNEGFNDNSNDDEIEYSTKKVEKIQSTTRRYGYINRRKNITENVPDKNNSETTESYVETTKTEETTLKPLSSLQTTRRRYSIIKRKQNATNSNEEVAKDNSTFEPNDDIVTSTVNSNNYFDDDEIEDLTKDIKSITSTYDYMNKSKNITDNYSEINENNSEDLTTESNIDISIIDENILKNSGILQTSERRYNNITKEKQNITNSNKLNVSVSLNNDEIDDSTEEIKSTESSTKRYGYITRKKNITVNIPGINENNFEDITTDSNIDTTVTDETILKNSANTQTSKRRYTATRTKQTNSNKEVFNNNSNDDEIEDSTKKIEKVQSSTRRYGYINRRKNITENVLEIDQDNSETTESSVKTTITNETTLKPSIILQTSGRRYSATRRKETNTNNEVIKENPAPEINDNIITSSVISNKKLSLNDLIGKRRLENTIRKSTNLQINNNNYIDESDLTDKTYSNDENTIVKNINNESNNKSNSRILYNTIKRKPIQAYEERKVTIENSTENLSTQNISITNTLSSKLGQNNSSSSLQQNKKYNDIQRRRINSFSRNRLTSTEKPKSEDEKLNDDVEENEDDQPVESTTINSRTTNYYRPKYLQIKNLKLSKINRDKNNEEYNEDDDNDDNDDNDDAQEDDEDDDDIENEDDDDEISTENSLTTTKYNINENEKISSNRMNVTKLKLQNSSNLGKLLQFNKGGQNTKYDDLDNITEVRATHNLNTTKIALGNRQLTNLLRRNYTNINQGILSSNVDINNSQINDSNSVSGGEALEQNINNTNLKNISSLNLKRRFQKLYNETTSGNSEPVITTNVTSESSPDKIRRIKLLKFRRPVSKSLTTDQNTLQNNTVTIDNEIREVNKQTNRTLNYVRKKLIRKNPVIEITQTTPETEIPITNNGTRGFRKVIRKILRTKVNSTENEENNRDLVKTINSSRPNDENKINTPKLIPSRTFERRRPFKPTRLSLNSTLTTNTTQESVRPVERTRNLIKTYSTINRFRNATRLSKPKVEPEDNYDEDENDDEEDDEEEIDENPKISLETNKIIPNLSNARAPIDRFNRTKFQSTVVTQKLENINNNDKDEDKDDDGNDDDEDDEGEDDDADDDDDGNDNENDDEENIGQNDLIKPIQPSRNFKPNRPEYIPKSINNLDNDKKKSNVPIGYSRPSKRIPSRPTNKPKFATKPLVGDPIPVGTFTPLQTTPALFKSTNTKNYERKYYASTENAPSQPDNSLLEDLNVDALNARNKKIFEKTSKKHTTIKPKSKDLQGTNYTNTEQNLNNNITTSNIIDTNESIEIVNNFNEQNLNKSTITISDTIDTNENIEVNDNFNEQYLNISTITTSNTIDTNHTNEVNNFNNNFQEDVLEYSITNNESTENPITTTTAKYTTLTHVFSVDDQETTTTEMEASTNNINEEKLVEINRVVEVSSKENKIKIKNSGTDMINESETNLKIEIPSHTDKLGQISRIKLVNVEEHSLQNGGELLIESKSTLADYTPTEPTKKIIKEFIPVRNSIPYAYIHENTIEKKGRQLKLPEVLEVETSTIALEGLFDNSRQPKDLNIEKNLVYASSLGETSELNENNIIKNESSSSSFSSTSSISTNLEINKKNESNQFTNIVNDRNLNYIRPIVPLLRPESNESSPLVISIANLDKVILSKVPKQDSNSASSARIESIIAPPNSIQNIKNIQRTDSNDTNNINTDSDTNNKIQINTNNLENQPEQRIEIQTSYSSVTNVIRFQNRNKRPTLSIRRKLSSTTNSPKELTTIIDDTTVYPKYNRRLKPTYFQSSLRTRTNTESRGTTKSPKFTTETIKSVSNFASRRKQVRPTRKPLQNRTTFNDPEITTTNQPTVARSTTSIFRRRTPNTTTLKISPTTISPRISITTYSSPFRDIILTNLDQEAKSTIHDTKFSNKKYNYIAKNSDEEERIVDVIKAISNAPIPSTAAFVSTSTIVPENYYTITQKNSEAQKTKPTVFKKESTYNSFEVKLNASTISPSKRNFINRKPELFEKINKKLPSARTYKPILDYDYYDDEDIRIVGKSNSQVKVILHGKGIIECLDQGNFPHPVSCKKFISCAKMETGGVIGWEYTCPKGLSYDPVGGICNWASGLGCKE